MYYKVTQEVLTFIAAVRSYEIAVLKSQFMMKSQEGYSVRQTKKDKRA